MLGWKKNSFPSQKMPWFQNQRTANSGIFGPKGTTANWLNKIRKQNHERHLT
jgi:hypothetical protein